jgi:hypothetical protein
MHLLVRSVVLTAALTAVSALAVTKPPAVGPSIAVPPQALVKTAGQGASFSVTANGTTPLKYQWQFSGTNVTYGNISGATKATYTIAKTTPANAGYYRILVYNSVGPCTSQPVLLTVNPNFAGKYLIASISYNATAVMNQVHVNDGETSGAAMYGTSTAAGLGPFVTSTMIKGYLGVDFLGQTQTFSGSISPSGVVMASGNDTTLHINMIKAPDGTPIGFLGTGTPAEGSQNTFTSFLLGLNATTTAPKSAAACNGNYTFVIIGYNATAVANKNAANNDGNAQIGLVSINSGAVTFSLTNYATGGGDSLGGTPEVLTGTVSASGVISINFAGDPHPPKVTLKCVALNGQVIGIVGTATPGKGNSDNAILLGIKNTSVQPL